jgi:ABC-type branched-subunit amino acid transport system substrate-binding protein
VPVRIMKIVKSRWVAFALVAALAAASCGTRASEAQKLEALRGVTGGGAAVNGAATGDSSTSGGEGAGLTGSGDATAGASGGAAGGATGGAATGAGGGAQNAAPAGGNGGATDVGVTATTLTVANVSILTGPVPGLFAGAVNGTDAFLAYQNSQGGVYGRKLKLLTGDDQFDCGHNKALTESYVGKAFALVGSFSLFDNCGADVLTANPSMPDVHNALSVAAQKEPNNFSAQPIRQGASTGPLNYFKSKAPDAVTKVGTLVGDVQSARDSWVGIKAAAESVGYKVLYERNYAPTETDFTADIVKMQQAGVKMLLLVAMDVKAAARLMKAAEGQHWKPELTAFGASAYDPQLVPLAGASALENVFLYLPTALYIGEDRTVSKEVDLFLTWLKRTHPSAAPDLFTAYGWGSARLFVQALQAAGPKATRAGLIAALKNIHQFDANGLLALADPAAKQPPTCYVLARINGGKFARVDDPPNGYRCDGAYFLKPG